MESYKCKLCLKTFFNGRALGGHMRSHMPNLHKFTVHEEQEEETEEIPSQLSDETESDVSSSSSEQEEEERNDFTLEEGEIETNIVNLTRKRSKRTRKLDSFVTMKKMKTSQLGYNTEPETEPLHSSASDTTTEEDLAFCLMMLSRDKWKKKKKNNDNKEEIETEDYKKSKIITTKGRYKCETCGKMFKSYQALGGHRASHKKNRVLNNNRTEQDNVVLVTEKRIHECPICLRVFASGQALGGHKRSHGIGNLTLNRCYNNNNQVHRNGSVKERMIDLNLPAPNEEEEVSMVFQ